MAADGKIEIDIDIESKSAASKAKKAGSDIAKNVESGLKDVTKAVDNASKNIEKPLKSAADSAKSSFGNVGSAAKSAFGDVGDAAKSAAGDAASAFESIPSDAKGAFSDVSSEAKSGFDGVAEAADTASADAADSFEQISEAADDAFDEVGDSAEGAARDVDSAFTVKMVAAGNIVADVIQNVAAKVLEIGKNAIATGMDFDKAMSQVAATMGVNVDQVTELTDFAKEMGETTAFSASQAAEALNYMALAGYDAETSMRVLPTVLNLAAAGNMELAAASDMVTDAQSALGLTLEQTETMVDQMAKTSSKTNTSVSQLGDAFLTVGGTAKNLKGGTAELAQMLGILADNGIKGAEGGTALRNVILSLSAPTDTAAAKMEELGLAVFDAEGNMRPMPEIFSDLNDAMEPLTQQDKTDALNTIFNKVDLKSANALLGTSAERFDEVADAIDNAQGSAQKMADTQLDNLAGDVTLLESATEGFFISVSDKLTPALRQLTQFGTNKLLPFLTGAVKNFDKIAPAVIGLASGIVLLATKGKAVKTLSDIFQTLQIKIAGSTTAFKAMTTAEKAAAVGTKALSTALKAMQSIGFVLAITAAVEGLSLFAENAAKASKRSEDLTKATEGLSSIMTTYRKTFNEVEASMLGASEGAETYSKSLGEIRNAADDAISKTAELSDNLNETFAQVGTNEAMVSVYADTIEELTNKYDENGQKVALTAQEQGKLITAVEGLNEIMGTSYSVVDAQNGVLSENTDEILKSAEAWKQRALMEAQAAASQEIMQRMVENTTALRQAEELLATTQEKLSQAEQNGVQDLTEYRLGVEQAQDEVDRLNKVQDSLNDEYDQLALSIADLTNELSSSVDSLRDYIDGTEDWKSALEDAGIGAEEFSKSLSDIGVSTQDLSRVMQKQGKEGISKFIQAYQAGGEELQDWMLTEFGTDIEDGARYAGDKTGDGFVDGLGDSERRIINSLQGIVGVTQDQFSKLANSAQISGENAVAALALALADGSATVESSADEIRAAVEAKLAEMDGEIPAGTVIDEIKDTFNSRQGEAAKAAEDVTKASQDKLDTIDGETPSRTAMDSWISQIRNAINPSQSEAKANADSANTELNRLDGETPAKREMANWNDAISSARSTTKANSEEVANAAQESLKRDINKAQSWGNELGNNFANGILKAAGKAKAAATTLANGIKSILGHSIPKDGPLSEGGQGEAKWGEHLVQNLASGILREKRTARDAAVEVATEINDALMQELMGIDPMAQLQESLVKGSAAFNMSAMMVGAAPSYNTNTQNLNFYGDIQSPDIIARNMRMQQHYGLAGEYV